MRHGKIAIRDAQGAVIELIDAHDEEPFTLCTLEELVADHATTGKHLIIARVEASSSAENENKKLKVAAGGAVTFTYAAHHLNKIIFRTLGRERQFLFRLYANNPLTNTLIAGDVFYYMVKPVPGAVRRPSSTATAKRLSLSRLKLTMSAVGGGVPPVISPRRASASPHVTASLTRASLGADMDKLKVAEIAGPGLPSTPRQPATVPTVPEKVSAAFSSMDALSSHSNERPPAASQYKSTSALVEEATVVPPADQKSLQVLQKSLARLAEDEETSGAADPGKITLRRKSRPSVNNEDLKKRLIGEPDAGKPAEVLDIVHEKQASADIIFDAHFIGTDDDFLQKAAMRKLFDDNALDIEESKLFTIPPKVLLDEGIVLPKEIMDQLVAEGLHAERVQPAQSAAAPTPSNLPSVQTAPVQLPVERPGDATNKQAVPASEAFLQTLFRYRVLLFCLTAVMAVLIIRFAISTATDSYIAYGILIGTLLICVIGSGVWDRRRGTRRSSNVTVMPP